MRRTHLPDQFTSLGTDEDGREYVQCTRTGDVLIQTGADEWSHFADAAEWRAKTAAQLYPELIYLQRALKRVGAYEDIEDQIQALREAGVLLEGLRENIVERIGALEAERAGRAGRETASAS